MTDGRFAITPYPAGELADGLKVLSAVTEGKVECGHTASYYYLDRGPAMAFGTTLPFGLNATQQNAWLYYGGGLEAMQRRYREMGAINFPGGSTGVQMGGWFKREVNTVEDFRDLKMRIPGLGGKILERLGAEIKVLSGDKIFAAFEQGTIDAAEWKNPHADRMAAIDRLKPTIALSIHYNALPDDGDAIATAGVGMFWYNTQAHNLAVFLHNYLVETLDRPSYGVFWNNLALTRPHSSPAVLMELGFMINPTEFEWIVDEGERKKLAGAIAQGIVAWLGQ